MPSSNTHKENIVESLESGLQRVILNLDHLKSKAIGSEPDLEFLKSLLGSQDFQSLVKVHEKVLTPEASECSLDSQNARTLLKEVSANLSLKQTNEYVQELLAIFDDIHIQALLDAHDHIALEDYAPILPDIPHEVDEDEESVKIVRLIKSSAEPLGATIKLFEKTGKIHIARIMHGGAADRCGLIQIGDEVQEVNGISVRGVDPNEIAEQLTTMQGVITLKLVPCADYEMDSIPDSHIKVRAYFSYDPLEDKLIPCKEAGLPFKKGDILIIVNQDDENWWQARHFADKTIRAGLIPSRQFLERKASLQKSQLSPKSQKGNKANRSSPKSGKKARKLKKVINTQAIEELENTLFYENVEKYIPKEGFRRPLVLIGAAGVGKNTIKSKLISSQPEIFKEPTRSVCKKWNKHLNNKSINVNSKSQWEDLVDDKELIIVKNTGDEIHSISRNSIRSLINLHHVCVICTDIEGLKDLYTGEMKPFVIHIKPPTLDVLLSRKKENHENSHNDSRFRSDEDMKKMIVFEEKLERNYSYMISCSLVNIDLESTLTQILDAMENIDSKESWVPATWQSHEKL